MIYFIQEGENGAVKIGFAVDPIQRISQLQTANPRSLKMLCIIPGDKATEAKIHETLWAYRLVGEWFEPATEVFALMKNLKEPPCEIDAKTLKPYAILYRNSETSVTDPCLFCDRRHQHGTGDGHRIVHCRSFDVKKQVTTQDGQVLRVEDGYIVRSRRQ